MAKKNYGRGKGKDDPRKAPKDVKPTTTPEEQDAARAALEEKLRQKAARSRSNEDVRSSSKAKDVAPTPKVTTTKPSDPKPILTTEERMQAEVKAEDFQPKDVIGGEASPSTTAQVAGEMTPGVDVEAVKKLSATGGSDPLRPKSIDPDFEEVSEEEARAAEAAGLSARARRGASTVVNPIKTGPYDAPSSGDVSALPMDKNYRVDVVGPGVANAPAVAASREDRVAKGLGTPGDEQGLVDVMHNGKSYSVNPDVAAAYKLHRDAWEARKASGKRAGREFAPNEMAGGHEHALVRIARELGDPEITPESVHAYSVKVAGKRGAISHAAGVYQLLTKDRASRKMVLKPAGLNDTVQHPTETDAFGNPLRMKVKDAAFHTAFSSHLRVDGKSPSGYSVEGSEAAQPMIDENNNPTFRHTGFHSFDTGEGKLWIHTDPSEYENYTPLKNRLRSEIKSPTPAGSIRTGEGRAPLTSGRVTGYVPFSNPLQQIVDPAKPDSQGVPNTGPTAPPRVGIQGDQPFYVSRTARRRNMISGDPGYVSGSELDGMYDKAERLQNFGAKRESARASMGFDPTLVNHLNDQAAELTKSIADQHDKINFGAYDAPHEDVSYNGKSQANMDEKGKFTSGVGQQMAKAAMPKGTAPGPKVLQGVLDLGEGYDYPQDDYKIHPTYEYDAKGGRITGEGSTRDLATARPEDALLDVQTGKAITAGQEVAPKVMSRAEAGISDSTFTPEHQRFSAQFNALLKYETPDTVVDEDGAVAGHSKTDSFATNIGEKPENTKTIKGSVPLPSGLMSIATKDMREDVRMGTQPLFAPEKVEQTSYKGFEEVKPEPREEEVETPKSPYAPSTGPADLLDRTIALTPPTKYADKSPYLPSGGVDYTTPEPTVTPVESDPYQTSGATNKRGRPIDYSTGRSRKPEPVPHQDSLFTDAELMPPQNDSLVELPSTRRREAFLGTIGKSDSALIESIRSKDRGYKQITQSTVAAQPYSSPEIGDFVHHSRYGGGKVVGVKDAAHALTGAPDKHVTIDFGGTADLHDIKPLALSEHSRFLEKVQPVETFDRAYQDPENPNIGVSTQFSGLESPTSNMPKFTPKKSGKGR